MYLIERQPGQVRQAWGGAELPNLQHLLALLEGDNVANSLDEEVWGDVEPHDGKCCDFSGFGGLGKVDDDLAAFQGGQFGGSEGQLLAQETVGFGLEM